MSDISIVIPVVRPESGKRAAAAALRNAGINRSRIEIIMEEDRDGVGCPEMVRRLAGKGQGRLVCFLGDDTEAQPGWLAAALEAMAGLPDGWGVVGLNTKPGNDNAHWLADRRILLHTDFEFFYTGYRHCFCDDELKDIAEENGRWAFAAGAVIKHNHPMGDGDVDSHYLKAYKGDDYLADRELYIRRKRARAGFRLGIGIPLVEDKVHSVFFASFICMDKPEAYRFYRPLMPHGSWRGSIADARESIIQDARLGGCTHLLMMDTDQRYPRDTLTKLLSHDVDICGVRVHRRYQPFDAIAMRGALGQHVRVPDDEMFSGGLVEVDATGTGCLLFKMEVFDRVARPWFAFSEHDGKPVGEDIYFCHRARQAGVKIFVDTSIEVGHLCQREITRHDYEIFKKWTKGKENG